MVEEAGLPDRQRQIDGVASTEGCTIPRCSSTTPSGSPSSTSGPYASSDVEAMHKSLKVLPTMRTMDLQRYEVVVDKRPA